MKTNISSIQRAIIVQSFIVSFNVFLLWDIKIGILVFSSLMLIFIFGEYVFEKMKELKNNG